MAALSDGENYGRLVLYQFPKQALTYGPMQVEARIDQNPDISQLLTLWGQEGSRVIRGNLLVIPIENSILYVEPLYLQAEKSEIPELARVIVVYNNQVTLGDSLGEALSMAVSGAEASAGYTGGEDRDETASSPGISRSMLEMIEEAASLYLSGQEHLRDGNWSAYGEAQKKLGDALQQLKKAESGDQKR